MTMKSGVFYKGRSWALLLLGAVLAFPAMMTSCKEDISEDAYAIASKPTMIDIINETDSLSYIKVLLSKAKLGKSLNASYLSSVLSARGNYTVFAPSDAAVKAYVDSIVPGTEDVLTKIETMDSTQIAQIALNCIIDNGSENAYELADFPTGGNTFTISNLNDRRLTCDQKTLGSGSGNTEYYINSTSQVVSNMIEGSNGMLYVVNKVISPSTSSTADLISLAGNMKIMSLLLNQTDWADSLRLHQEEEAEFETEHLDYAGTTRAYSEGNNVEYMAKRYINYTVFAETDDVFMNEWGIDTTQTDTVIMAAIQEKCETLLGTTNAHGKYTDPENAVNQFVAYHILDGGMATDEFVHHFNEWGYKYKESANPQVTNLTVDVWDYYTTKGQKRGLLKITQVPTGEHEFYLNRVCKYTDDFDSQSYDEEYVKYPNIPGENGLDIKINALNETDGNYYDNNGLNGFYYPIDHILIYSDKTRDALASERIRMDVTTILPEMASNDVRGGASRGKYFPRGYFSNISNESQTTYIYYLMDSHGASWQDYQGDEFLIVGRYDFVLKLPPVPKSGTYELRMGSSNNPYRSMVQVYIGENPNRTNPTSLPIDQRESVDLILNNGQTMETIKDNLWTSTDETVARDLDRQLRNQGYMRAPKYMMVCNGQANISLYDDPGSAAYVGYPGIRRILTSQYFDVNKTYYLRFKSVLESDNAQFMFDYLEFVPTGIVNGATMEDIW